VTEGIVHSLHCKLIYSLSTPTNAQSTTVAFYYSFVSTCFGTIDNLRKRAPILLKV